MTRFRGRTLSIGCLLLVATWILLSGCTREPSPRETGFTDSLVAGSVVLIGELHGTKEIPGFVGDFVEELSERRLPVTLALELQVKDQPAFDTYIASPRAAGDRSAFFKNAMTWQSLDGRGSEAMFDLVDRAAALKQRGADLQVKLIDAAPKQRATPKGIQARDRLMGAELLKHAREDRAVVALVGNLHAQLGNSVVGLPNATLRPMGAFVRDKKPATISLDGIGPRGEHWGCSVKCGPMPAGRADPAMRSGVRLFQEPRDGFLGEYYVSSLTASPPIANRT